MRPSTSPRPAAAKNRPASSSRSASDASNRGRFSAMKRRARTACCRHVAGVSPDDPADLLEVVVEDVVEEEDRPLDRGQPLEQDEERHRQRVGLLGVRGRVAGALVGHERLRQPLADVRLAADAGRLEVVDRQAGDDRRQLRLRRLDRRVVGEDPLVADERLLHDVLGLADAPEHPIGDREEQRPKVDIGLGDIGLGSGWGHAAVDSLLPAARRRHRGGSGTGVSRPWRKPSRQLGQIGCQPSSRFAFAFDEPRPSVIIVTATSPASSRPSQAGMRSGVGAPSASAIAGMNSRVGAGLVVDDVVDAAPAALQGRERAAGRVVDVGRRHDARAVADDREHPLAQDVAERLGRARPVEPAVADDDPLERRLEHGALEELDRGERLGLLLDRVRIERIVLGLDPRALRLLLQPVKLWATNRLTPLAWAAARRCSVPSVRRRFVRANQRSKCRKSGVPDRAVISWMMASGSALATASPIPTASRPSTTTGSAPERPDGSDGRLARGRPRHLVAASDQHRHAAAVPTAPFAPATKTRMVGPPFSSLHPRRDRGPRCETESPGTDRRPGGPAIRRP